jgi:DNA-binding response OmpR family regulator
MPKILLIDDDADVRDWISTVLRDADYTVEVLPDGSDAMRLLSLGIFDLALIDHHLPGKSGLTLVRELRAVRNSIPVVMLTADLSQQLAVEGFRAGASDFITKPIDPDYLKIIVSRTLSAGSKTLKNAAYRALGYTQHKSQCSFHGDSNTCDCGLKELFEDIQDFS